MENPQVVLKVLLSSVFVLSMVLVVYAFVVENRNRKEIAEIKKMLVEISSHVQSRS